MIVCFRLAAMIVIVLSTLTVSGAAVWSDPKLLTDTALSPADGLPIVANNDEIIVGAWISDGFEGSVFVQRWTIDGKLLEPVPHVLPELNDIDDINPRPSYRVLDIVWDGAAFLVIWSSHRSGVSSTVIDRLDADLQHQSRRVITTEGRIVKARASEREIILIHGTTADFYSTAGAFIASIPFVIPGGTPEALDIATDGHKFLVSGVFAHGGPPYLYTIAVKSDRSASDAVIIPVETQAWRYAINVSYGGDGYVVTTVFSRGVVKTYRFDVAGMHTSTSTLYDYTDGSWAVAPEVVWNGSNFELYWLPPNNPILVRSKLSPDGVPLATAAIEMDQPGGVLPRVVQAGSSRTYLWTSMVVTNRRLFIDHKPADVMRLDGQPATWQGQTELRPQLAAIDGATVAVWIEQMASDRTDQMFVLEPRAHLIDGTGSRAIENLPECTNLSLASSDVEVVLLSACGGAVSIARLDRESSTRFSDPVVVTSEPRAKITAQAVTWNGSGWTIVWTEPTEEGGNSPRVVKMQRLSASLEPQSMIAEITSALWLEGAYVSHDGHSTLVVVAAVNLPDCQILCPPYSLPMELIRIDEAGVAIDRWTPFNVGGVPRVILAPSPEGHVVVTDGSQGGINVLHIPAGDFLAGARVEHFEGWGGLAAAIVQGGELWVGTNGVLTWIASHNLRSGPLWIRRLTLDPEISVKGEWLVARHTTGAAFSRGMAGAPDLYTSEMVKNPSDGLSPRIYVRSWIEELRRRRVRSR
ncbi:MAG TPA: hypothetical protein VF701_10625 [Thermoanaerobaculia bacterium]